MPPRRPGQRLSPEEYATARQNGWTDAELREGGYEPPPAPGSSRQARGLPGVVPDAGVPQQDAGRTDTVVDALRGAGQGLTFGFSDELTAAAKAALDPSRAYGDVIGGEREKLRESRTRSPVAYGVGEFGAGLAIPGVGAAKVASRLPAVPGRLRQARTILQRLGAGAGAGAVTGAVNAAGVADEDKLRAAGAGAALGGVVGAGLTAATPIGRGLVRYLGGDRAHAATEKASDALMEVVEQSGQDTPQAYLARAIRPGASGRRLMDADPAMQELSFDVAKVNPKVQRELQDVAEGRIAAQNPAIAADVREALDVPNVVAEKAQRSARDRLKKIENTYYTQLWRAFPQPIATKEAQAVFGDAIDEMPAIVRGMQKNARLTEQQLSDLMRGDTPTLQGLHRLKVGVGRSLRALKKKEATGNLTSDEAQDLFALSGFGERIDRAIATSPGASHYAQIQQIGQRGRAVREALGKGTKALDQSPDALVQELQGAQRAGGVPAVQAYRQGVGSRVTRDAADTRMDTNALLHRFASTPGTTERLAQLVPQPQRLGALRAKLDDRQAMAATNAGQVGRKTPQREILKGARTASTAMQFGEAGTAGAVAGGQSPRQSLQLLAGSLIAKALQGQRHKSTEQAAEMLSRLLQRAGDDPTVAGEFTDLADALRRVQAQRLRRATLAGAAGGTVGGRMTRE